MAAAMSHDGWRASCLMSLTPTEKYLHDHSGGCHSMYRHNPAGAGADDGGTTGNTVSQLQL